MKGDTSVREMGQAAAAVAQRLGQRAQVDYAEAVLTMPPSVAASIMPEDIDSLRHEVQVGMQASGARRTRAFLLVNPATAELRVSLHCLVTRRDSSDVDDARLKHDVTESLRESGSDGVAVGLPRLSPAPEAATLLEDASSPTHRIDVVLEQFKEDAR